MNEARRANAPFEGGVTMKRVILATGLAVTLFAANAQAADKIKLGFEAGMSGVFGIVGGEMRRGLDLALSDLDNKLGGVPVTLFAVDDKADPAEAVRVSSKLIDDEKVDIVTGLMASNTVLAVERAYLDAGIFTVGALAGPKEFAGKDCNPNAFHTSFENEDWDTALGTYMSNLGIKSTYFMAADYQAGWEKVAGTTRTYKGKAIGPVFTPLTQLDFSAEIAQLRAAKPDAVYVFYPGGLGIAFLKQFSQAGLQGQIPIYSEDTMASELSFAAEGDTALGVTQSTSWSADLDNPANKKFVAEFIQKFGRRPAIFAALQYDAIMLIDTAVAEVKGNIADKDAFRAALRKADFHSIRGPFKFANNHFPIQNIYILDVKKDAAGKLILALKSTAVENQPPAYRDQCPMKW
jgi:branched-chain amino acid transport system substrate-binding protein